MEKDNKKPTLEEVQQYFKHAKKVRCVIDESLIFEFDVKIKEGKDCYYIGSKDVGIDDYAIVWDDYYGWATIVEVKEDPNNIEVIYDVVSSLKNPNATHYELWKDTEAIDVIKKTLTPEEYKGYLKGNILKYKLREKGQDESDKVKIKDYTAELNSIL